MIDSIKKLKEVCEITGLSKTSIYRLINSGTFPKQIKLGERSSGWLESELTAWLSDRVVQRDQSTNHQLKD